MTTELNTTHNSRALVEYADSVSCLEFPLRIRSCRDEFDLVDVQRVVFLSGEPD